MVHAKVHTQTAQQHAEDNTGYTYSISSSYSSTALDYERQHRLPPRYDSPRMSRRSLRLHGNSINYADDSLLDSSHNRSVTHSNDSFVQRETRTLRSRRSNRSVSGSSSLLQTPVKNQSLSLQALNSSMHSCAASDASLLSSLLDESSIQERTHVDSFWGLDQDGDARDQTLQVDHNLTVLSNDTHTAQTQTSTIRSGYICKDCIARRDNLPAYTASKACSSSSCSYSSAALNSTTVDGGVAAAAAPFSPPYTTVYSRERTRRHRAGMLGRFSETSLYYSRKAASSVVCLFTMLMQSALTKTCHQGKALLCSLTDRCVGVCRSAATSSAAALTRPAQFIGLNRSSRGYANGGHASYCGTMNLNEQVTQKDQKILNGPLCDDCKGKQNSKTVTVSLTQQLIQALWLLVAFAGSAASAAVQWLGTAWYNLVMLNSLINVFFLTRVLPVLRKLLLFFLPLLLLLVLLGYLGVTGFWTLPAFLPAANETTEPILPVDVPSEVHPDVVPSEEHTRNLALLSAEDSERLARIEKSLATLWDKVTVAGGKQDERHAEVLGLCKLLKDELRTNTDRESMSQWVTSLLEQKIVLLRQELETEAPDSEPEELQENLSQESRIAQLEVLLQDLALKTEELQKRQDVEAEKPLSTSAGDGVDFASHEALLAKVHRLEKALGSIRTDLQGVLDCKGRCDQLDSLHSSVSLQVKQELKSLLYGEEAEGEELPDSLLQWLSTKFVSHSEMLVSLGALEKHILGNLSLQLEQMQLQPSEEQVTQTVLQTTREAGLSEQDVQLIVQNALKLYSEDRTGLVDYALESGGGSILSTRCSETYETKTALMSLFGFPLWYFSQSPRAVIQPDVHPGNCWAFKGSTGYLVIRLSVKIVPTAFSLEHIPKALSPTGNISSAPHNFVIYGLEDEQHEEGHLLGEYIYEEDGNALQTYQVTENNTESFQIIELRVLSNWGHPEYTCLYRFRVHGNPAEEEEEDKEE